MFRSTVTPCLSPKDNYVSFANETKTLICTFPELNPIIDIPGKYNTIFADNGKMVLLCGKDKIKFIDLSPLEEIIKKNPPIKYITDSYEFKELLGHF